MKPLVIDKLSDHFGQYEILLKCNACNHTRRCFPSTLAAFAGWDTQLDDIVKRLRCTRCNEKQCTAAVHRLVAPRKRDTH